MLKSTAIVLAVAGLVATGVAAAILNQPGSLRRAQGGPSLTGSTLIVIDGTGARACSQWAAASSTCVPVEGGQAGEPGEAD
jgi:hypothetical protein